MTEEEFESISIGDTVIFEGELDGRYYHNVEAVADEYDGEVGDCDFMIRFTVQESDYGFHQWWVSVDECDFVHFDTPDRTKPKKGLSAFLERTT